MRRAVAAVSAAVMLLILSSYGWCADIYRHAGTSGGAFLKIPLGVRPSSMGGAFTSVGGTVESLWWNPSGLSFVKNLEASALHYEWFQGINYEFLGAAKTLTPKLSIGAGIVYLSMAGIEKRTSVSETPDELFGAGDMSVSLAGSYTIWEGLYAGGTLKIISNWIDDDKVTGTAIDAGMLYRKGSYALKISSIEIKMDDLSAGAVLTNLGPSLDGDPLPLTLRLGGSVKFLDRALLVSTDLSKARDGGFELSLGAEGWIMGLVALRAGYSPLHDNSGLGALESLTAGLGAKYKYLTLDYCFAPFGNLGNTHRISLTCSLP